MQVLALMVELQSSGAAARSMLDKQCTARCLIRMVQRIAKVDMPHSSRLDADGLPALQVRDADAISLL